MAEYQWSGADNSDLGNEGNWFNLQSGPPAEPGANDVAIIEFGPALTGTLNVSALDLIQQGPGEPALSITGSSTQVTAASAGIGNTVSLAAGALLQVGTLSTAAGCAFTATGAGTSVDVTSTLSLAGSIVLTTGASMYAAALSIAGTSTVTVSNAATLDATVSTSNTMTIGSTAGTSTLLLTSGASANLMSYDTEGDLNIGGINGSYGTLSVTGQANLIASPDNLVIGAGGSSNGVLSVAGAGSSGIFECWGTVFVGVAPGATGTVSVTGGGYLELDSDFGVADVTSDTSAKVIVSGVGSEIDAGPSVNVGGETVYDNAGTGQITVQSGGLFRAFDHTFLDSGGTVTVTGAGSVYTSAQLDILAQGTLQVASSGSAQVALCTNDGGIVRLTGGTLSAKVEYSSQSGGTLIGAGTLTAAKIVNGGMLNASGGTLHVTGAVTGIGQVQISSGAAIEFDNSVGVAQSVNFGANANQLLLADAQAFGGRIHDFAAGDAIDLLKTAATSLSYATGSLTVLNGSTKIATLYVSGSYTNASFKLASDGHGGSLISYVAAGTSGEPHGIGAPGEPIAPHAYF